MASIQTLLDALPPFRDNYMLRVKDQDTNDIIVWLLKVHPKYAQDYDKIYQFFDTGDVYSTCEGLWRFLKYSFKYSAESLDDQSVRSPAAILEMGNLDCKHYSLFIGGVLDAIKRNCGDSFTWTYRLSSYNGDPSPGHVFVVVKDNGKDIWVDPVLTHFDERKQPSYYFDKKPMKRKISGLYEINGIGDTGDTAGFIDVDPATAFRDFCVEINIGAFDFKTLMNKNAQVTNGPVKAWFEQNGFDFSVLDRLLKQPTVNVKG